MKTIKNFKKLTIAGAGIFILFLLTTIQSCQKSEITASTPLDPSAIDLKLDQSNNFKQVNLDADVDEYAPLYIDLNLVNAWGLAMSDEGEIWVSSADKGVATVYDADGATIEDPINIPFQGDPNGGNPTGALYNSTLEFIISNNGEKSEFIYATENGTIVAAASGNSFTVADRSSFGEVYKGLAMGKSNGNNYLYATDFRNAHIDVLDKNFNYVSGFAFQDATMPVGYAPFGIQNINGQLYVTYAKQLGPENKDDDAGAGHGFVDIYNTDGSFVKRFDSQGNLNSPWAIAEVPGGSQILIGNFGSGKIMVFDMNGNFMKFLKSNGTAIKIDGLWALTFPFKNLPEVDRNRLYFTAGPDEETHGVFGYLIPQ
ncbi:MAG: TIGR03118 family protein [Chitinophagales bacterium]|nr:TIGR03118 family protein [Chitinophagales bacterium]